MLAANELIAPLDAYFVWRAHDRIAMVEERSNALLRNALASLAAPHPAVPLSFPLRAAGAGPLRAAGAGGTLVAHIVPIRGTARDLFSGALCVLILTPVSLPQAPPASLVQSLFDLTRAETKTARGLAAGKSVDDPAAEHAVSGHTVRFQVKSVLGKTGCRRQAELVALLNGLTLGPSGGRDNIKG